MFNIGPVELMVVVVMALLVFGPAKLPELMGSAGKAIREFQRASRELTDVFNETQQEFTSAVDDLQQAATVDLDIQTQPAAAPANAAPQTAQPEEYETAAAMLDPVAPFPHSEPAAVTSEAAVAEAVTKPRRTRRKKTVEPVEPTADAVGETLVSTPENGAEDASGAASAASAAEQAGRGTIDLPHANGAKPRARSRRPKVPVEEAV